MGLVLAMALAAGAQVVEVRVPEGFVRAEADAPSATSNRSPSPTSSPSPSSTSAGTSMPAPDPCRAERSAYLRRLLQMTGVDLDDPIALLEGLAGPGGYQGALLSTPLGVLPGVDPVRPLAWDAELRSRARDLAACARTSAPAAP